jgi:hypothetical protein
MKNSVLKQLQQKHDASPISLPCLNCLPSITVFNPVSSLWNVTPAWPCAQHLDPITGRFRTSY